VFEPWEIEDFTNRLLTGSAATTPAQVVPATPVTR
jgi:hypothetical protein